MAVLTTAAAVDGVHDALEVDAAGAGAGAGARPGPGLGTRPRRAAEGSRLRRRGRRRRVEGRSRRRCSRPGEGGDRGRRLREDRRRRMGGGDRRLPLGAEEAPDAGRTRRNRRDDREGRRNRSSRPCRAPCGWEVEIGDGGGVSEGRRRGRSKRERARDAVGGDGTRERDLSLGARRRSGRDDADRTAGDGARKRDAPAPEGPCWAETFAAPNDARGFLDDAFERRRWARRVVRAIAHRRYGVSGREGRVFGGCARDPGENVTLTIRPYKFS